MAGRYCAEGDLVPALMTATVLAQLTQDDPDGTTTDTTVLDAHIAKAEALVEGFLSPRYEVPLASVPVLVADCAARLVRFGLMTMGGGAPDDWLIEDRKDVMKLLADMRDGKVDLGLTAAGTDPGAGQAAGRAIRTKSRAPVFGRSNLEGY